MKRQDNSLIRGVLAVSVIILSMAGTSFWLINRASAQTDPAPSEPDIAQGEMLYAEYCASCHGADLEGQPDWRSAGPDGVLPAPPHDETGHTWHHADDVLFQYTKLGGEAMLAQQGMEFKSGMPGFGEQLSDVEISNILAFIKSTWPERHRAIQAERSRAMGQ